MRGGVAGGVAYLSIFGSHGAREMRECRGYAIEIKQEEVSAVEEEIKSKKRTLVLRRGKEKPYAPRLCVSGPCSRSSCPGSSQLA